MNLSSLDWSSVDLFSKAISVNWRAAGTFGTLPWYTQSYHKKIPWRKKRKKYEFKHFFIDFEHFIGFLHLRKQVFCNRELELFWAVSKYHGVMLMVVSVIWSFFCNISKNWFFFSPHLVSAERLPALFSLRKFYSVVNLKLKCLAWHTCFEFLFYKISYYENVLVSVFLFF